MANAQNSAPTSWWERFSERCYRSNVVQVAREMQNEAPKVYDELLNDLQTPLESVFEREVARQLDQGAYFAFVPAKTLMPAMMQRFGLDEASFAADSGFAAIRKTCNACPVAGQCWRAMRRDADADECRSFCPNAEAFDRRAAAIV
ncbi:MAG: hypothetical protein ACQEUM_00640 [Pseudomonadota bacterium]